MQEQTLIQKGGTPPSTIRREHKGEVLHTKEIRNITVVQAGKKKEYIVVCNDSTPHRMDKVGQNPKFLLFYNREPTATCGNNYVPLFNDEIKEKTLQVLKTLDMEPLEIQDKYPKDNQWRMTAVLEKDVQIPIGHLSDPELWDWGISITNSYDLSMGIYVSLYLYRQICSNGLYAFKITQKKHFLHVESERKPEKILEKLDEAIKTMIENKAIFFERLNSMSKTVPTREQVRQVLRRMNVRKYESEILADHGIIVEWNKSEIKEVQLGTKIHSEFDVLNAMTSLANDVTSTGRQFELQHGMMEKILECRTIEIEL